MWVRSSGREEFVRFSWWDQAIQQAFEASFWVSGEAGDPLETRPDLVHKHSIYKDSVGAASAWCDYQLRPNFSIAMVVVRTHMHARTHARTDGWTDGRTL